MTDESSRGNNLPITGLRFEVKWDSVVMTFHEASGLDIQSQPVQYRQGQSATCSTMKMPGLKKNGNIILKKGLFIVDEKVRQWINDIKMNTVKRKRATITLFDDTGNSVYTWTVNNALPVKVTGIDVKGNEGVVESIELSHEGLTVAYSK